MDEVFDKINTFPSEQNRSLLLLRELNKKEQTKIEKVQLMSLPEKDKSHFKTEILQIAHEKSKIAQRMFRNYQIFAEKLENEISNLSKKLQEENLDLVEPRSLREPKKKQKISKKTQSSLPSKIETGNEVYCICQKNIEGAEMILCDSPTCRLKWYHLECLQMTEVPAEKWFCPECVKR